MRYATGIDLGTTNSALAWVDLEERPRRLRVMEIPQLVAAGDVARRPTLPSFLYLPGEHELPAGATALPWDAGAHDLVGEWARAQGSQVPGHLISSAKSWLCHPGVDRHAPILPWAAAPDVTRRSPVDASAAYLAHIAAAFLMETGTPLGETDLVVTVPASFDEVARELTVEAARRAGLERLILVEEPQAAFYSYLEGHRPGGRAAHGPGGSTTLGSGGGAAPGSGGSAPPGSGGSAPLGSGGGAAPGSGGSDVPSVAGAGSDGPRAGDTILVCDIGGGTTDFTVIRCTADAGAPGGIQFERTAVGDHLLLGGDNMDLALAHRVEKRAAAGAKAEKLDAQRFQALALACRTAKEKILGHDGEPRDSWTVHLAGRGRSLIGGGVRIDLGRDEVEETILEGFFPRVERGAEPARPQQGIGLREFGLPYAHDPAVTRHLAAFLRRHDAVPDAILFNGGVLHGARIRERIVEVIGSWFGRVPRVLENPWPDLAVARGAAWFALARRGEAQRIAGGAARAYYVEIDAPGATGETRVSEGTITALCVAARGENEGRVEVAAQKREFEALTNRPVRFRLLSSSDRNDAAGDIVTVPRATLADLPPIVTVLRFPHSSQDVSLAVRLLVERTEIGTLDLHLLPTGHPSMRFKLAFDLRHAERAAATAPSAAVAAAGAAGAGAAAGATGGTAGASGAAAGAVDGSAADASRQVAGGPSAGSVPAPETLAPDRVAAAEDVIRRIFDKAQPDPIAPAQAMKELIAAVGRDKAQWPTATLRSLWEPLKALRGQRGRTAEHESRWLNLVGYCLRPGYGYALDDWRVKEAWRLWNAGLVNDKDPRCRLEWWILWRRISGGLTRNMQDELQKRIFPHFLTDTKKKIERKAPSPQEAAEMYRVAGALERIPAIEKWKLGEIVLPLIERDQKRSAAAEPQVWTLGRLGARVPLYGPTENVISQKRAERWVERLLALDWASDSASLGHNALAFATAEIARASGDRARDLDDSLRQRVAARLAAVEGGSHLARLVLEPTQLEAGEERFAFGESLPAGLRLSSTEGRPEEP